MEQASHPPIYAADRMRVAMKRAFHVTADTPPSLAYAWTQQLDSLERILDGIMDQEGAMERIKSTPLPLVYVSHLRTFLLLFLLALPYIWEREWRWLTIPVVGLTSFAMLGLEGASQEVEVPFSKNRGDHMNMDAFCLVVMDNIQQTITDTADREMSERVLSNGS